MEAGDDGFSFSQNLISGLSQISEKPDFISGISQSQGYFSEDSQTQSFSQAIGVNQTGINPPKRPSRTPMDHMNPPNYVNHSQDRVSSFYPQVKKAKYNLPNWTKGLLKTAEENQKLKNHDALLTQQGEDQVQMKTFVQDLQKTIASFPELLSQMIKQSTDFLTQKIEKQNGCLKEQMLKDMNDSLAKEMEKIKEHHLENTFGTWNYLTEIKIAMGEIKACLNDQTGQSDDVKAMVDKCCDSILKVQKHIEGQLPIENARSMQNYQHMEMQNTE